MAKKVQPQPVDILPAPSSSDDETEDQDGSSSDTDNEQPPQSQKPQNQPPQIEQEEEESDDDSDDETEDDEPVSKPEPVVKKPSLQEPQKPQESDDEDDDDDESGTDSDETQNSPTASGFTIKPVISKPVSKSPEPKTPTSKPARVKSRAKRPAESEETDKASKPVSKNQELGKGKGGNGKRAAEVEKVSKSKKSKVSNEEGTGKVEKEKDSKTKKGVSGDDESGEVEEKKSIIKWSEKDEDALLGGIIEYKAETGEDVNSKVDTFYEYAKDLLSVSLTKSQLYEKIRRLKKKFQTNSEKWQNGEEPVFSKPHESKVFELSQKIWGSEGTVTEGNDSKVKTSKKKDKKDGNVVSNASTPLKPDTSRELFVQEEIKDTIMEDKKEETTDVWSLYPKLCASLESETSGYLSLEVKDLKEYVKGIVSRMGEQKARELEDEWQAVLVMDHQLYAKRAFVINKQAEAVSQSFSC